MLPQAETRPRTDPLDLFAGGGDVGERMRAYEWSDNPLGPVEAWPQNLKTCVRIVLTSRQPMFVWWGDSLINLYNDAYRSILGGKHPWALGKPASEVWKEIWDQVGPRAAATMGGNEGTYDEALMLIMERYGYPEETYYTFSYSPIPNDKGGTGGILCANTDDTQRIISGRRMALLGELAARSSGARSWREVCAQAEAALETSPKSLPFALVYTADPEMRTAVLDASVRMRPGDPHAPARIDLSVPCAWPLRAVLQERIPRRIPLTGPGWEGLPTGGWDRPPQEALAVPIAPSGTTGRPGVLIAGLNPYRPLDEEYGKFLGLVASQIASSLATAHAYEEERKRAEALAELDKAKTAFFSNVSHEFRTPLTLMMGPLEDGLREATDPVARERLELIRRNGVRLLKLVNNLLDFSRVEAGRAIARYRPTDLARYTTELASVFRSAMAQAGLEFAVECDPLPDQVYVDQDMWEKIVLNLLSNALKFTFRGGVAVRLSAEGDRAVLRVSDTGVGIPREELPKIFTRFHRVQDAQSRTHEGSGIGLALVQELTRMHGGSAEVASEPGHGSVFTVAIPFGSRHLPADHIAPALPMAAGTEADAYVQEASRWLPESLASAPDGGEEGAEDAVAGDGAMDAMDATGPEEDGLVREKRPAWNGRAGASILLVDDNRDMREYVRRILAGHWTVDSVADGMQALERARSRPPDLIVSDVMMPVLDGFGLLKALRADPATESIPVILLSARAGQEATEAGLGAGADDYMVKPFSSRELIARVSARLEIDRLRRRQERELRRQADRLRELEEFNRTIISESPDCIKVLDAQGRLLTMNKSGLALMELDDLSGMEGRDYAGMWGPRHREAAQAAMDAARSGRPARFQGFFPTARTASPKWWDVIITPLFDAEGRVHRFLAVSRDITASREAENEIHKFQSLVEQSSDFIGFGDLLGDPIYINAAGRKLVGLGPDQDLRGVKAAEFYFPEDLPGLASIQPEVERNGHWAGELRLRHFRTGKAVPVWLTVFILKDPGTGEPAAFATVSRDLTQQKDTEEHLRQAQKMEAIGKLAGGIAHDFNNLLTGINGFAELALGLPQVAGDLREYLDEIRKSGERAALLTNQLLAYSRKQILAPKVISLNSVLTDMRALLRRLIGEDIELQSSLEPGLGSIKADPGQMQQIILNLALNARDAMPEGGLLKLETANVILDDLFLATHLENKPGPYVMLSVRDSGIGMSPELLSRVFEPFFTTKPVGKGTGMGLPSVYGIVKQSEGAIDVESAPGKGSTFKIFFPMVEGAEDADAHGAIALPQRTESKGLLLLVEDEESVRRFVARVLEMRGYRVLQAKDGGEGLRLAETAPGELRMLITDLVMPRMGGLKLAERFKALRPEARIVLMSGYTDRNAGPEGAWNEGIDYLQKPFRPDQLIALVESLLDRTGSPR
jgi:PAS domain S-box-containing protein